MSALKPIMRRQKVTYKDVARRFDLSVAGVKKFINAEDGSTQRLVELCDFLGLTLQDAVNVVYQSEQYSASPLQEEQEQELLDELEFFRFFWSLLIDRMSLEDVRTRLKVPRRSVYHMLRKLDDWGVLCWGQGDEVKLRPLTLVRFIENGPISCYLRGIFLGNLMARPKGAHALSQIQYFRMSRQTLAELVTRQRELTDEFARRALQEMRTIDPTRLTSVTFFALLTNASPADERV